MPSKDNLYNGRKGIGFENPSYFEKAKDLRPTLYDEKVIGLRYTPMFLTHSDEALEIKKFKRSRENKIKFAYDYGNLNASYVNEKINFKDDYFQDIINPDFDKIDSPFQQTSSLKPYVPNMILEKIIIDLEDEVVNLLEKEKANLETIKSLKSKRFESSKKVSSESENQSENDCHKIEKVCDKEENSKVFALGMFKLNVSRCVSPISMSKSSCDSKNVEIKLKRKRFEMSRDVLTVGSTIRIPLLYRGEYSQWVERFMNYLEEQTDGKAMINSIKNSDQPLPHVTQVSIAGTTSTEQPHLKDKSMCNKTAKDLWDALARHMLGSEYGEQDRKAAILYEYETFKATEGELLLDTYIRYLQVINDLKKCGYSKDNCKLNFKFLNNLQPEWKQYAIMIRQNKNLMDININALYNILKQNQGDVNDAMGSKKKTVVVTSDPLALIVEKTNVSRSKDKVVLSSNSKGSEADDFSELKKLTALLAKAFN
uniref:Gag-Pol polyprotein n=1 Tax=Tanacetum cinerariifolium TaxID=118510 RepID=A0A699KKP2_TANCI|nr:hypothetical protein [Tanacetum cinerariifolium]